MLKKLLLPLFLFLSCAAFGQAGSKIIIRGSGGSGSGVTDTIPLHNQITQKLNIADTANKWLSKSTSYLKPGDTSFLHNSVLSKLNAADTSYLHSAVISKLAIADTLNKWLSKATWTSSIASKITNADTLRWGQTITNNNQIINGNDYVAGFRLTDTLDIRFGRKDTITLVPMGSGQYFFYGDSDRIFQYGVNYFGGNHVSIDSSISSTQKDFTFNVNFSDMKLRMVAPMLYPVAGTEIDLGYTPVDLFVDDIAETITGTSPDVTYEINYGDTRNQTDGQIITARHNTATSGGLVPPANYSTLIPAGSFVWLKVTAVNGSPVNFGVTLNYHQQ